MHQPQPHKRARGALVIAGGSLQGQRALIEADRLLMGIEQASLVAGAQEVADGLLGLFGALPVVGQQAKLLLDALREEPLQRLGDLAMGLAALAFEQRIVGGFACQFMFEDELSLRRPGAFPDQFVALQAQQMRLERGCIAVDCSQ